MKLKQKRDYADALKLYLEYDNKDLLLEKTSKSVSRVDFPINFRSIKLLFIVGLGGGFFMGFIGVGASLIMVFVMSRLHLNM
jgi:hypothetical protein